MEFLFSCSARHLTRSLSSLLRLTLEEKFHIYARPGLLRAYGKFLARRAPSHDGCNFTSAESSRWVKLRGFKTFKIFFPLYLDWDWPFGGHNENKTSWISIVSKNNVHLVISSDEISFGADNTALPNVIRIMAEKEGKLSDFNWGFATMVSRRSSHSMTSCPPADHCSIGGLYFWWFRRESLHVTPQTSSTIRHNIEIFRVLLSNIMFR